MKLFCYLKNGKFDSRPVLLHESDSLDELKSRAVEYANNNPSFRSDWASNRDRQELRIEFDYRLVIQT